MAKNINLTSPFAQQVLHAAQMGCTATAPGTIRDAEQLCGPTFWASLKPSQAKLAGTYISAAVDQGLLPLKKKERSPENHWLYERQ